MKTAVVAIAVLCLVAGEVSTVDAHPPAADYAKKKCKRHGKKHGRKCKRTQAPAVAAPTGPTTPAKVTLTVDRTNAAGGTVDSSPTGISCGTICSAQFDPGTPITLTASADSAYFQKGWSGAGCSGHGACSFVIDHDTAVTADLVPKVTVDADVAAGTGTVDVSSSATYGICTGSPATTCTVLQGDDVSVTATAASGSHFVDWSGDCSGTNPTYDFTSIDTPDKSCHANFAVDTFSLTVTKLGAGNGTVTSTPAGIDCGATCAYDFPVGTVVSLSAAPDSGSVFAGWGGACTGVGSCIVNITAPTSVSATFDPT